MIKVKYDYTEELQDDEVLHEILTLAESIDMIEDVDLAVIDFAISFINDKIEYLSELQESFKLANTKQRLTGISKIVTSLTLEVYIPDLMADLSYRISSTLDILYQALHILEPYIINS